MENTFFKSLNIVAKISGYNIEKGGDLTPLFIAIIQTGLGLLGTLFLILIMYGGFLWMTDRGNEEQVLKARKIITGAIIGLIIVLSSYAITFFVIKIFASEVINPNII